MWRDLGAAPRAGETGGVTFKDVPVGHIFRFMKCDCLFRRAQVRRVNDRETYALVEPCREHALESRFKWYPMAKRLGFADPDEHVRYDALAAMLEEQWKSLE